MENNFCKCGSAMGEWESKVYTMCETCRREEKIRIREKEQENNKDVVIITRDEWNHLAITLSTVLFRLKPNWCQSAGDPILLASQLERATREE